MKTIYKYDIPITDYFELWLPGGAQILKIECQHSEPIRGGEQDFVQLWAAVDTNNQSAIRKFAFYGTGHKFRHDNQIYIGSVILAGGALVFHLYEIGQKI